MHSEKNNSLKYFWQWNACLRVDHPVPWKSQEGSGGANLAARCAAAWVPASLGLYRLSGNTCFQITFSNSRSQLPRGAGAPTSVTHQHPSSQRAPWGPSTDSDNPPTAALVSDNKGNLCPWGPTGPAVWQGLWGWKEGGKKKKKRGIGGGGGLGEPPKEHQLY